MKLRKKKTYKSLTKKYQSIIMQEASILKKINDRLRYLCEKNPNVVIYDDPNKPNDPSVNYNTNDVISDLSETPVKYKLAIIQYLEEELNS